MESTVYNIRVTRPRPSMYRLATLQALADRYGADTAMDYVSDRWGSETCTMTPAEAIAMHVELGWTDEDYAVRPLAAAGEAALIEKSTGNAILVAKIIPLSPLTP